MIIEQISPEDAESLCRTITADLPEYFGLPAANESYAKGIKQRINFAAKIENKYVGLISLEFPYSNNTNIYWMGILQDFHRKGIGSNLMGVAESFARNKGALTITVETVSKKEVDNGYLKTYEFYESMDFAPMFDLKPQEYECKMVYMVKKLENSPTNLKLEISSPILVTATLNDYPFIQNMARFMTYDMSRSCGFISEDWGVPKDGLYECYDLRKYFDNPKHNVYIVKIGKELAGFAIVTHDNTATVDHSIEEFYIVAKFQSKGIAEQVATQLWKSHKGNWSLSVIPENLPALKFWRKAVDRFTSGKYKEEIREVDYDQDQPHRHFLTFRS